LLAAGLLDELHRLRAGRVDRDATYEDAKAHLAQPEQ
jgi:hypothetical protein